MSRRAPVSRRSVLLTGKRRFATKLDALGMIVQGIAPVEVRPVELAEAPG